MTREEEILEELKKDYTQYCIEDGKEISEDDIPALIWNLSNSQKTSQIPYPLFRKVVSKLLKERN